MTQLKMAQTVARLKDVKINERELVDEWILITYDLPVTEKGNEARQKFLKTAPKIGAMMHSKSVYLMPNTSQAQIAAVELSSTVGGEVYIWTSKLEGPQAKAVTNFYDHKIQVEIERIENRIRKMDQLTLSGKHGMSDRMRKKSGNLYTQLLFAVAQRGANPKIIQALTNLENRLIGTEN